MHCVFGVLEQLDRIRTRAGWLCGPPVPRRGGQVSDGRHLGSAAKGQQPYLGYHARQRLRWTGLFAKFDYKNIFIINISIFIYV